MRKYYDFRNEETGEESEHFFSREELERFVEENPKQKRVFKMPQISTSTSATYVDGFAPNSRKQAIALEKEIAALTAQEYGTRPDKRAEIQEEIKKIKQKRKAPVGANKGGK